MKKILLLILTFALFASSLTALVGCKKEENTLVCGVTIIPGLNEQLPDGSWTGFESEFAMEVGKILGMEVKFQEIKWDQKFNELNSGAIDCVWNGFTANAEENGIKRSDLCDFSYGYMLNQQCVVVKTSNADSYKSVADLAGKKCCVEGGSAGDTFAQTVNASEVIKTDAQINAFTEVKSGAVQYAVVDIVLAQNVCGKGNYSDLSIVTDIELASEIYAIGFKKGSDLTAKVNAAIKQLEENGKLMEIATKYGFENAIKVTEKID
ncbi:MAG: transporter substrate-binding domain-containing protein [Ruminococcaceae bacterium]|nr:transporter substrate-binding domain-containing protein [Oscillospiraceae bacterium]